MRDQIKNDEIVKLVGTALRETEKAICAQVPICCVDGEPRTATNTLGTDDTDRLLCSYPPAEDVGRTEPSEPINVTRGWS